MAMAGHAFGLCYSNSPATRFRSTKRNSGISASREKTRKRMLALNINAAFWGIGQGKRLVEPPGRDFDLSTEHIIEPVIEGKPIVQETFRKISISVVSSILRLSSEDWDACSMGSSGQNKINPFLTYAFLSCLEETGCAVEETGWLPQHIVARDEDGTLLGVVPLYIKSHSYGEFVFDHSWADAYYNFGSSYYPKLQCSVPFTPVTGQRILVRDSKYKDQIFEKLVIAMKQLTEKFQMSSLHITFPTEKEWEKLNQFGFLQRIGMQYHWKNRDYKSFDDFLMDLKQSKRKTIRQERKKILSQNLQMKRLQGSEIKAHHWDSFYKFYRNTTDNNFQKGTSGQYLGFRDMPSEGEYEAEMQPWTPLQPHRSCIALVCSLGKSEVWSLLCWVNACEQDAALYLPYDMWDAAFLWWGRAFLTREFFHMLGSKLGDRVLLIVAEDGENLVAGALNLIGGDTLFGRLWGCLPEVYFPNLHFEACYYQAIEAAIEWNLSKVEAGAQGEHKIQRGYMPVTTYSCHYIRDNAFKKAIGDFLARETPQVKLVIQLLADSGPYKDGLF